MAANQTLQYLDTLIAFPTVSRDSNLALIEYVRHELETLDIDSTLVPSEDGRKANLFATIGPDDEPGIVLSGHTDVVPVEGQNWTSEPFKLTARKGKISSRVTAHGLETHSSLAPLGVNAIHMAIDLVNEIRAVQAEVAETGARDSDYDIAYTTLHVGKIAGGEVINIVPNRCSF